MLERVGGFTIRRRRPPGLPMGTRRRRFQLKSSRVGPSGRNQGDTEGTCGIASLIQLRRLHMQHSQALVRVKGEGLQGISILMKPSTPA